MRTAMRQIAGVFAALERATIAKRMRDGCRAKAAAGGHSGGSAPYGWRTQDGELHTVPAEQEALRVMLALRRQGWWQAAIARTLDEDGHPTRSGRPWSDVVVGRILNREAALTPAQREYQTRRLASQGRRRLPRPLADGPVPPR